MLPVCQVCLSGQYPQTGARDCSPVNTNIQSDPPLMYPRQQPSTGAYCFWDELCLKGFSNSDHLWIRVGAAAGWIGMTLWLSTIHVLFLVSKMNFKAIMPGQLHRMSQMQTKGKGYRISCSPDKERPGHKWVNCLEMSPFPPKCFFPAIMEQISHL